MTGLLIRLFIKDSDNTRSQEVRGRYGRLAGLVGIVSNTLLFALKFIVGLFTNSIAIMADAINNLSDSASSVITLVGFKLAGIPADEQHPYGHARFEYISGLAVSCIIMAIGVQFLLESVKKVMDPEPVGFSAAVAVALLLSIGVKLWQGLFYRNLGRRINSQALTATSMDSRNDVLTTSAVLVSAVLAHFTGWDRLDGIMGTLVALFILYSGVGIIRETLNPLIGLAPDSGLVEEIQTKILSYPTVIGTHDLIVHNYGPERCFASVHVEVPANQDIMVSHDIIDNIERDFALDMNIALVIHLDPVVTDDPRLDKLREQVADIARDIDPVLTIHDFRMVEGATHTNLIFDVVVPPRYKTADKQIREQFDQEIKKVGPDYFCVVTLDRSYIAGKH